MVVTRVGFSNQEQVILHLIHSAHAQFSPDSTRPPVAAQPLLEGNIYFQVRKFFFFFVIAFPALQFNASNLNHVYCVYMQKSFMQVSAKVLAVICKLSQFIATRVWVVLTTMKMVSGFYIYIIFSLNFSLTHTVMLNCFIIRIKCQCKTCRLLCGSMRPYVCHHCTNTQTHQLVHICTFR